jgi:hypothetical protein
VTTIVSAPYGAIIRLSVSQYKEETLVIIDILKLKIVFTQLSFIWMLRGDYYYMFRPAAIFR